MIKTALAKMRRRFIFWALRRLKYPPGTVIIEDDVERYIVDCRGSMRRLEQKGKRK